MVFLRDHQLTSDTDEVKLNVLHNWFKDNLDVPKHFHKNAKTVGWESKSLSWFKDSAKEHILKVQELLEILERYDLIVERVSTKYPGTKVYEDDIQISAIPFSGDIKKVK